MTLTLALNTDVFNVDNAAISISVTVALSLYIYWKLEHRYQVHHAIMQVS